MKLRIEVLQTACACWIFLGLLHFRLKISEAVNKLNSKENVKSEKLAI